MANIPTPKPGSTEAAILSELLELVNKADEPAAPVNPPPSHQVTDNATNDTKVFIEHDWAAALEAPAAPAPRPVKIFLTGRLGTGKDYVARAADCVILGFADPLYGVASRYFGRHINATQGKEIPGVRPFLQTIGQWGRGEVSELYPLTTLRALFMERVREDGLAGNFGDEPIDWASYGHNPNIWLDALVARAAALPSSRIAVTNCRFANEFERLQKEGFEHWHVMASAKTWTARLEKQGLKPESPAVKDVSEQLAAKLDASVIRQCSTQKNGPKLKCVWSDESTPAPSSRLSSVADFLRSLQGGAQ